MSVSEIKLYQYSKRKWEEAQSLVEYVEAKIEAEFHDKQYILATKQDLLMQKEELLERMDAQKGELLQRMDTQKGELLERMDAQKEELLKRIDQIENRFSDRLSNQGDGLNDRIDRRHNDLQSQITELKVQIKSDKADVIKWMFIFWVGQLAGIFALLKLT